MIKLLKCHTKSILQSAYYKMQNWLNYNKDNN